MKDKFTDEEKKRLEHMVEEQLKWIEQNSSASKEEMQRRLKDLENAYHPIMQRIYGITAGRQGAQS